MKTAAVYLLYAHTVDVNFQYELIKCANNSEDFTAFVLTTVAAANCNYLNVYKGTGVPTVKAGYWRADPSSNDTVAVGYHICVTAASCLGGNTSECAAGIVYGSPLCGTFSKLKTPLMLFTDAHH
jgi:hypothetical protein